MKLSEAARKAKSIYQKRWAAKNPGKQREYIQRYWEKRGRELVDTDTAVTDKLTVTTPCLNCGQSFKAKRKDAKFCSDACRVRHNRKNRCKVVNALKQ